MRVVDDTQTPRPIQTSRVLRIPGNIDCCGATMGSETYYPMTSTASASSRSSNSAVKALRAVAHSRTAGVVAAVVGAAVTSVVGAALLKKARASANKKKAATKKRAKIRTINSPRRSRATKAKTVTTVRS